MHNGFVFANFCYLVRSPRHALHRSEECRVHKIKSNYDRDDAYKVKP